MITIDKEWLKTPLSGCFLLLVENTVIELMVQFSPFTASRAFLSRRAYFVGDACKVDSELKEFTMSLSILIEPKRRDLFKRMGVVSGFSEEDINRKKMKGVDYEYTDAQCGFIVPKEYKDAFLKELSNILQEGMEQDLVDNGRENIIRRELIGHECYLTADLSGVLSLLSEYGITESEVLEIYSLEKSTVDF